MELVHSLEKTLSEYYAKAPHLPADARNWLASNVWWLAIVGIVLSVFAILSVVGIVFAAFGLSAYFASSMYSPYADVAFNAVWIAALIGLVSLVVTTALLAMAVNPLKSKAKKGWTILFVIALISLVLQVAGDILSFNIPGIIVAVFWAAIGAYFLFEIRGEFGKAVKVTAKPAKVVPAKAVKK